MTSAIAYSIANPSCEAASMPVTRVVSGSWRPRPASRPNRARSRPRSFGSSTRTGARRTTSPSARSTCSTTRCFASRSRSEHIKPRLLGHFGHDAGAEPRLRAPQPRDPGARPRRDLRRPARATAGRGSSRTPTSRARTARSIRTSSMDEAGMQRAVPAVLVPGRDPEPRRARDAGLDPRGRRARLLARARVRRGLRQPRSARRLRRRRRRGRDGAARGELALEQVPQPGAATARCCRSST